MVKSLPNPNTVLLSGGQFDNHEVYAPKGLVGEGVRFESAITNNMAMVVIVDSRFIHLRFRQYIRFLSQKNRRCRIYEC